jgi:hypothetical protein
MFLFRFESGSPGGFEQMVHCKLVVLPASIGLFRVMVGCFECP